MSSLGKGLVIAIVIIFIAGLVFFTAVPAGRQMWNNYTHSLGKADEVDYATKKKVEDTARSMIASYESDKLMYEQYKDSENEEKRSWAEAAKTRANNTASKYNNYILQNSYVWEDNVPADINYELEVIK